MEQSEPTRRRALWALGAAGLAAVTAGDGAHRTAREFAAAPAGRRRALVRPPVQPPGWTRTPLTASHQPVRTLHDLLPAAPANAISLTIDDGPHPEWTPRMLDLLAEHQVHATFSLIGLEVKRFPKLAERIATAGHQLCNHTMNHPIPFNALPHRRLVSEVTEARVRIADATGITPRFFRAPGGSWSPSIVHTAHGQDMICIDWDIDPRDWARPGTTHITKAMLRCAPGDILLCHDGGGDRSETIKALRTVIPRLKQRGMAFVSL
ncbi:polysaccharide deacetylase family protein [Actinomadura scrupuli]|uniref:polysaccharide deacetylase family protein n=1 Tax=Actinomadura scrupuli TaxID=559629 RepID=UPI003D994537